MQIVVIHLYDVVVANIKKLNRFNGINFIVSIKTFFSEVDKT